VTVYARNGLDWTKRFALIADAFSIPVERAIFDGEVVVIKDGRTNFSELQAELASGRQRAMVFYAFDLLFVEGFDLRGSPQIERKPVLNCLRKPNYPIRSCTAITCRLRASSVPMPPRTNDLRRKILSSARTTGSARPRRCQKAFLYRETLPGLP